MSVTSKDEAQEECELPMALRGCHVTLGHLPFHVGRTEK